MVAICVAITFIGLVLIDFGLEKWKVWQTARTGRPSAQRASGMALGHDPLCPTPEGVHLSDTHTWLRPDPTGGLEIGADVLIAHTLGAASRIRLPQVGDEVAAGQPLFCLEYYDNSITVPSPLTGRICGVNSRLQKQPGLLNSDPYGRGWVCHLTPTRQDNNPVRTLFGEEASQWVEREFTRLREFVFAHLPPNFALEATRLDGGLPAVGCLAQLDAIAWRAFEAEFLRARQADGQVVR